MSEQYAWLLGTLLLSAVLNTFLFGLTTFQFAVYFYGKFGDPLWLKGLVGTLAAVDGAHSCLILYVVWFYCIQNYTRPDMLDYPLWAYMLTPILEVIPAFITQAYLATRVFKLTRNIYLYGIIMALSLATCSFAIAAGAKAFNISSLSGIAGLKYICIPWLVFQAATDVTITTSLSWSFITSKTGNKRTDWALEKLLRRALQTGIPATCFAIASLATYLSFGTNSSNLYAFFSLPLGRVYTLTLMDTLIVRKELREGMQRSNTTQLDNFQGQLEAVSGDTATEEVTGDIPKFRVPRSSMYDTSHDHERGPSQESDGDSGKDVVFGRPPSKAVLDTV